jgi:hypothetical protein
MRARGPPYVNVSYVFITARRSQGLPPAADARCAGSVAFSGGLAPQQPALRGPTLPRFKPVDRCGEYDGQRCDDMRTDGRST